MTEPAITINGHTLTPAQAMTIRVSLESHAASLQGRGLGEDTHGQEMTRLYLLRINEIRAFIFARASG